MSGITFHLSYSRWLKFFRTKFASHSNHCFRSSDGESLFICSTDGYCTIASFSKDELGKVYTGGAAPQKTDSSQVRSVFPNFFFVVLFRIDTC